MNSYHLLNNTEQSAVQNKLQMTAKNASYLKEKLKLGKEFAYKELSSYEKNVKGALENSSAPLLVFKNKLFSKNKLL